MIENARPAPAAYLLIAAPEQFTGELQKADFIELSGGKKTRIFLFNVESATGIQSRVEAFDPVLDAQIGTSASQKGNDEQPGRHGLFDHQRAMEQMRVMLTEKPYQRDIPERLRKYAENQLDMPVDPGNSIFISNGLHIA